MSGFNPSQVSFAAGEVSPAISARVDLALRQAALARCENFKPRPQGPALMRAGSWLESTWPEADHPRLFEFRVSGSAEDYVVAVGASKVRLYSKSGGLLSFFPNLIVNGGMNTYGTWTTYTPGSFTWQNGYYRVACGVAVAPGINGLKQTVAGTVIGHRYRVRYKARYSQSSVPPDTTRVYLIIDTVQVDNQALSNAWAVKEYVHTATLTSTEFDFRVWSVGGSVDVHLDDISVVDLDGPVVSEWTSPWSALQLPAVQYSSELSTGRTLFALREVRPQCFELVASDCADFYAPAFAYQPSEWGDTNWPGVIEVGFQGRTWLASTPAQPNFLWGSKSADAFTFDLGTGLANEAIAVAVTTRGRLEWVQGQRVLLSGSESTEHIIQSASGLIKMSDIDVQDASGFGSAAVQARHIGDQVLFVDQSGRRLRGLDYSWEKQAWWSKAITWAAEHLFDSDITEVHFSRAPDPIIIVVLASGELRACTYDRVEGVAAWWRVITDGTVHSAAVARTADGDELWLSVTRGTDVLIERLPLHETGVAYVDSAVTGLVAEAPTITGLDHLEGQTVRIIIDGALYPDQVVMAGAVTVDPELAGLTYIIGLPYLAKLRQLPLEGGLATGSSQGAKRRRTNVRLRLNDSALPLVNGKRAAERLPADPMNTPTDLVTGDVDCIVLGWEDDGALTIEQDLPFRTEILAIFGSAQANEV